MEIQITTEKLNKINLSLNEYAYMEAIIAKVDINQFIMDMYCVPKDLVIHLIEALQHELTVKGYLHEGEPTKLYKQAVSEDGLDDMIAKIVAAYPNKTESGRILKTDMGKAKKKLRTIISKNYELGETILKFIPKYVAYMKSIDSEKFMKSFPVFVNQKTWEDEIEEVKTKRNKIL